MESPFLEVFKTCRYGTWRGVGSAELTVGLDHLKVFSSVNILDTMIPVVNHADSRVFRRKFFLDPLSWNRFTTF